jgi:hypothetical protein
MVRPDVIASHVENLLEGMLETDHVVPDNPGQWSIRAGTALYTVRVKDQTSPNVEVYAVALEGVRPTRALYERINDLNLRSSHSRWFVEGHRVVVAGELVGETLDAEELASTCREVAINADQEGQALHEVFGGTLRFPVADDAVDEPPNTAPTGMYL